MKKYPLALIVLLCVNAVYAQRALTLAESKRFALQNNWLLKNSALET